MIDLKNIGMRFNLGVEKDNSLKWYLLECLIKVKE